MKMDEEVKHKVLQQVMDIFIIPEIEQRKKQSKIKKNFVLSKAQIVFSLKNGRNEVRLNEEVKAVAKCKVNCPKNKDDSVYEKDITDIKSINLTEKDPNCAHITLLQIKGRWIIAFDFRYNKERIQQHIEAAKEFFESAKCNLSKQRLRPFYEDAFACAELAAKSVLLQLPIKKILSEKWHTSRIKRLQNWAELGNIDIEYSTTLEKLHKLRSSARYLESDEFKKEDPEQIIQILKNLIKFVEKSLK